MNGDFETSPYNTNGTVAGWVVSGGGNLAVKTEGSTTPSHSAAFGVPGGTLAQTFNTTIGQTYNLDFDTGIFGRKTGGANLRVQVTGSGSLLNQTVAPAYVNTTNPNAVTFAHFHFTFIANSTTTTVQFSDSRSGNASGDIVLDSVAIR